MDEEKNNEVFVRPTKAGNGFKMNVNGVWLYTSRKSISELLSEGKVCVFGTIADSSA